MPFDASHLLNHEAEVAALVAKHQNSPRGQVVFYGSSSIRLWPGFAREFPGALNLGFGGSTLWECAHFYSQIVAPLEPRALVVYAGDNDLALGATPDEVWESLVKLLDQSAQIPLAFLSLKPSPARRELRAQIEEANHYCEREIWSRDAHWVDIYTPMLDENREPRRELYAPDELHLSRAGYALWAQILKRDVPFLQ